MSNKGRKTPAHRSTTTSTPTSQSRSRSQSTSASAPASASTSLQAQTQTQINHPAHALLARSLPTEQASQIFIDKIKNKPLLLHPSHQSASSSSPAARSVVVAATTNTNTTPNNNSNNNNGNINKPIKIDTIPTDKRALRRHIRLHKHRYYIQHRRPRPLSAKEKRQLGLVKFDSAPTRHADPTATARPPPEGSESESAPEPEPKPKPTKYQIYQGLHKIWHAYCLEVLGVSSSSPSGLSESPGPKPTISGPQHGSLLTSLDYHGMKTTIIQSQDPSLIGIHGIVVQETKNTFVLVTPQDQTKRVMKKGVVFQVVLSLDLDPPLLPRSDDDDDDNDDHDLDSNNNNNNDDENEQKRKITFHLHGSQLEIRPVERAVRKFKWNYNRGRL